MRDTLKLFTTGFIQVFFVAVNTYFLSKSFFIGVFICGFMISFIWSWNVKKVKDNKTNTDEYNSCSTRLNRHSKPHTT